MALGLRADGRPVLLNSRTYLIDTSVADLSPWQAIAISVGLLVAAWLVYDILCRVLGGRELALGGCILGATALAAWGSSQLFAPRAAFLQVGAMLGTIMAGNVFFSIIPAHWGLIRAKQAGHDPDPAPGIDAKRRSVHNNYLTLPVLFTMIAGHFAFTYGANRAWLVLIVFMLLGAWARLFFNLRHGGRTLWAIPAVSRRRDRRDRVLAATGHGCIERRRAGAVHAGRSHRRRPLRAVSLAEPDAGGVFESTRRSRARDADRDRRAGRPDQDGRRHEGDAAREPDGDDAERA